MKDKAIRLLLAGTFKTGLQSANWLSGENVTPELREEFQKLESERDQYRARPKVSAESPTYYSAKQWNSK